MLENAGDEWYGKGLRFECTQCGNCCTGESGWVWFTPAELEAMAQHVGLLPFQFRERYAQRKNGRWTLSEIEREGEHDCVFVEYDSTTGKSLCSIYPVRPAQCRTWPLWHSNLKSPQSWEGLARGCPGIAQGLQGQGQRLTREEIQERLDLTPEM